MNRARTPEPPPPVALDPGLREALVAYRQTRDLKPTVKTRVWDRVLRSRVTRRRRAWTVSAAAAMAAGFILAFGLTAVRLRHKRTDDAPVAAPHVEQKRNATVKRSRPRRDPATTVGPTSPNSKRLEVSQARSATRGFDTAARPMRTPQTQTQTQTQTAVQSLATTGNGPENAHKPPDREPAPRRTGSTLREESNLVRSAWQAFDSQSWAAAQHLVDQHRRRFADGALVEEREALATMLRCQRVKGAPPTTFANHFEALFPRSPLVPRVRRTCSESSPAPKEAMTGNSPE